MVSVLGHLTGKAEIILVDFPVKVPGQEKVLAVRIRIELDAVGVFLDRVGSDHLAGLGVPVLDPTVEAGGEEKRPVVRPAKIADCLRVADVGPDQSSVGEHIPQPNRLIIRSGQEVVAVFGEEPDSRNVLGVSLVCVAKVSWNETVFKIFWDHAVLGRSEI